MATAATIPVEEYLHSEYKPYADYVDGQIEQRPMDEFDHATWQQAIEKWFDRHAKDWGVRVRCESRLAQRLQGSRRRSLGPCPSHRTVLTHPPIAIFEVLSPENTTSRLLVKLDDYQHMGIRNIFIFDPRLERAYLYEAGDLRLCNGSVSLNDSRAMADWEAISELRD